MKNNIFSIIISALKAKIMPLWIKISLWSSPAYLRSQVLSKIRIFFVNLLNVRPRNRKDYYSVFRWLVSKRLAFALVVIVGVASVVYVVLMLPKPAFGSVDSIPSYHYRSIPLKFRSGTVQILAKDGHVAYVGGVAKGVCTGKGSLYNTAGTMIYEGQFSDNKFNGSGTLYYPGGGTHYKGAFTDNLFHGMGSSFRPSGSREYEGEYAAGEKHGHGKLYNSTGTSIFEGTFLNNAIVYNDFVGKPTQEVAQLYSGEVAIYSTPDEYCVAMPEINAVYAVKDGSNTLENQWTVSSIYVLANSFPLDSQTHTTLSQVQATLGNPLYYGSGWADLPEAVALNLLAKSAQSPLGTVSMKTAPSFDNVFSVSSYDRNFSLYLYRYERDGLLYTFYCTGAGVSDFVMYSIESAKK